MKLNYIYSSGGLKITSLLLEAIQTRLPFSERARVAQASSIKYCHHIPKARLLQNYFMIYTNFLIAICPVRYM